MKKILIVVGVGCALIGLGLGSAVLGNGGVKGNEPGMMASPQTIVLSKVSTLTIHTNIPEVRVAPGTVTLNDIAPLAVWADDCGHLAARFSVAELKLEPADEVTLTLCGTYITGSTFTVQDVVRVK